MGIAPGHGIAALYAAVCSPPFLRGRYRLSLGPGRFRRDGDLGSHFHRPHLLFVHNRGHDGSRKFSFPYNLLRSSAISEETHGICSCAIETNNHQAPVPDQTNHTAQGFPQQDFQDFRR